MSGSRILPHWAPALVLLSLLAVLAACSSDNEKGSGTGHELTLGKTTFNDHGTKDVTGKGELELEADDYYFSPSFLKGKPGERLKLEVANDSQSLHNLSITGQQLDTDIPQKGKVAIDVTFPASGVVLFFCKYHTTRGMNGELLAGDATPQPATDTAPAAPTKSSGYGYP